MKSSLCNFCKVFRGSFRNTSKELFLENPPKKIFRDLFIQKFLQTFLPKFLPEFRHAFLKKKKIFQRFMKVSFWDCIRNFFKDRFAKPSMGSYYNFTRDSFISSLVNSFRKSFKYCSKNFSKIFKRNSFKGFNKKKNF